MADIRIVRNATKTSADSKQHYSAAALAALVRELGLSSLPSTAKGWAVRAEREGWPWRTRKGRGGGKEYPQDVLPAELFGEPVKSNKTVCNKTQAVGSVLHELQQFANAHQLPVREAITPFVLSYNQQQVMLEESKVREHFAYLSVHSVRRWLSARDNGKIMQLFSRGKRGRLISIDHDQKMAVYGLLQKYTNITAVQIHGLLKKSFADDTPSLRVIQRFIKNLKTYDKKVWLGLTDPERYKNNYQPAFGLGDYLATHVNAEWQLDSTMLDAANDQGKRPVVVGVMDVYTRRVKYLLAESSHAGAVKALLRAAILDWGVPDMIHTDNGSDYISKEVKIAAGLCGIQHLICRPGKPEEKAFIERMFGTLTTQFCTMLDGYVGPDVISAQKIRAKKSIQQRRKNAKSHKPGLPNDIIQARLDDWLEEYNDRPHSSLEAGVTPNMKALEGHNSRRFVEERVLDVLLTDLAVAGGQRTVGKSGIHIGGVKYVTADLKTGQRVTVKLDPINAGKIWVFNLNGEFLGEAINKKLLNVDLRDVAVLAKQQHHEEITALRAEARAAAKALEKANRKDHAGEIKKTLADNDNIEVLPLVSRQVEGQPHTGGAVTQISEAMNASREETPAEKYSRWQRIDAAFNNGEAVSDAERRFHKTYQNHSDWKVRAGVSSW